MGWKRVLRDYFTFNRRERRGVVALLSILVILLGVQLWLRFAPQDTASLVDLDPTEVSSSELSVSAPERASTVDPIAWKSFDPNTASKQTLVDLGMELRVAERLDKYRSKGGDFHSPSDLLKLYGIDSSWVDQATPYMQFPMEAPETDKPRKEQLEKEGQQRELIDLNKADTNDLKSIRGIGSYYAREIVRLRDRLGGFLSYDQLLDVYNIRDEAITIISENTFIDPSGVRKIDINSCPVDPLGQHPYLSWKQAKVIVSYRQQHGPYASAEDIVKTKVVSDSLYRKLAPYLTVE